MRKLQERISLVQAIVLTIVAVSLIVGALTISKMESSLHIRIEGRGTVAQNIVATSYPSSIMVELVASPTIGYRFMRWEGDIQEITPITSVRLKGNTSIVAVFVTSSAIIPTEALDDPTLFVRSYMIARMEALIQQRPELIDPYFNLDDPISRETHLFESLRSRYVAEHLLQAVGGLAWYTDEISVQQMNEGIDTAYVNYKSTGDVQTNDMDKKTTFNDEVNDIFLRKGKTGRWYIEKHNHADFFVHTYGRVDVEAF
ncbi:MAG: hypothetical protein Q8N36_01100, partial [bacterium]|nr:hypothetical protein [bacterium]